MGRVSRAVLVGLAAAALVWADGGTLVLRTQAGPLTIAVFSSPHTVRVGAVDLSVFVQGTRDPAPVSDAAVTLRLRRKTQDGISEVFAPATHAAATNKMLYAARMTVPEAGVWKLAADVQSKSGSAQVAGELRVLPPASPLVAYWPYFAVVPLLILLFLLNRWLRKRRDISHPPARA